MKLGRKRILPEGDGVNSLSVGVLQGKHDADANLVVSPHDRFHVTLFIGIERQHVLDGCHARSQTLERTQQGSRVDLFGRTRRILRRQRIEPPRLKRHLFERALGQNIMRMVVRVHETRQHQMIARVDDLYGSSVANSVIKTDADDLVTVGNCTGRSPGFAPRRMRST